VHTHGSGTYSTAVPHVVATTSGPAFVVVNQAQATAVWTEVGTVWLTAGNTTVQVRAVPGQTVLADAVGLMRSRLPSGAMTTYGVGTNGTLGGTQLAASGRSGVGGTVRFQASRMVPGAGAAIGLGFAPTAQPLLGGTLLVLPDAVLSGAVDALGLYTTSVVVPWQPSLLGVLLFAQAASADAAGPEGFSLSAGVMITIG